MFGSNLAGRHGAGSAKEALIKHGAVRGQGVGRQGQSYAIPTKYGNLKTLPLDRIRSFVQDFLLYAKEHPELTFRCVKIGCGLASYPEHQIAPLFEGAPKNCILPRGWRNV